MGAALADPILIGACILVGYLAKDLSMSVIVGVIAGSVINYFVDWFFVNPYFPETSPLYLYFARVVDAVLLSGLFYLLISKVVRPRLQKYRS